MKDVFTFCVLLLCVDLSLQVPRYMNCSNEVANSDLCAEITCLKGGIQEALGCPLAQCAEGEYISNQIQDNSKVYPDCCPKLICKRSRD